MYLLLVFLPFIGSCLSGLFGRYLGSKGSAIVTVSCLFLSFLLSLFAFYEVGIVGCFVYIKLTTWISSEVLFVDWGFMFDSLTVTMCVVVTFISCAVHLYSTEYMSHDPHLARFMSYLSLFTFFMLILVSADNFIQMFVGWEGIGLCSFLLINFWFTRIQANKAAIKAMILNRIGDFCLVIGILLIFNSYKAVDYSSVAVMTPFFKTKTVNFLNLDLNLLEVVGGFLFLGAVGKSAQVGLHTWLPDAMEGPTPVSALIHAATLVTAGVFLLARTSFIYEHISNVLGFITILGAITSFVASTTGLVQNDMKRVIAYSTCSQLGYMVFACGLSNYSVGIFHLSNHAFFKALLFLSAGSVIHAVNDEQDMRKMGGLKYLVPFTYSMIVIGSLALIGFPFLTGFYSKDLILEVSYGKYNELGYFSYFLGSFGAFLTAFYSTRLLYLTFLSKPTGFRKVIMFAQDSGVPICVALGCLAIPSIFVGYYTKDSFVGIGSPFFGTAIHTDIFSFNIFDAEFVSIFYKTLPVHLSLLGFISAFILYNFNSKFLFLLKTSFIGKKLYNFLNRKWFFDKIYNEFLGQFFFKFGYSISYKFVDRGMFEILGPTGLSLTSLFVGFNIYKMQTQVLYHLMTTILVGISLLLVTRQFVLLSVSFDYYLLDYKLFILCFVIFFLVLKSKFILILIPNILKFGNIKKKIKFSYGKLKSLQKFGLFIYVIISIYRGIFFNPFFFFYVFLPPFYLFLLQQRRVKGFIRMRQRDTRVRLNHYYNDFYYVWVFVNTSFIFLAICGLTMYYLELIKNYLSTLGVFCPISLAQLMNFTFFYFLFVIGINWLTNIYIIGYKNNKTFFKVLSYQDMTIGAGISGYFGMQGYMNMSTPEDNPTMHYYYHTYDPLGRGYHFHTGHQLQQSNYVKGALGDRYNPKLFLDKNNYVDRQKFLGFVWANRFEIGGDLNNAQKKIFPDWIKWSPETSTGTGLNEQTTLKGSNGNAMGHIAYDQDFRLVAQFKPGFEVEPLYHPANFDSPNSYDKAFVVSDKALPPSTESKEERMFTIIPVASQESSTSISSITSVGETIVSGSNSRTK